jgi:hypothetical protein
MLYANSSVWAMPRTLAPAASSTETAGAVDQAGAASRR